MWKTFVAGAERGRDTIVNELKHINVKSIAHGIAAAADPKSRIEMLSKMALNAAAHSSPSKQWNSVKSGVRGSIMKFLMET